jgi:hypothetical protein
MTPVYSGGLVYEYSEEGSGYGLVKINGNSVSETSDFTALESALAKTPAPSGDGGYKSSGQASECPSTSDTWEVTDFTGTELPAIPQGAEKYMSEGAGTGPGLTGDGSQNAGGASSGTATAGSGTVTATGKASASSKGAASSVHMGEMSYAPFVVTGVVAMFSLFGAALL